MLTPARRSVVGALGLGLRPINGALKTAADHRGMDHRTSLEQPEPARGARLAVQAITQTLDASFKDSGHTGALRVKLLRKGHETLALGELDVTDAIAPDASLVTQH